MATSSRSAYVRALGAEAGRSVRQIYSAEAIRESINNLTPTKVSREESDIESFLSDLVDAETQSLSVHHDQFLELQAVEQSGLEKTELRRKAALEITPLLMGVQYLLHGISGNWNNESEYALAALSIHASEQGVGQPQASRFDRFQEILREYSVADVGSSIRHTAEDFRISDKAFEFSTQLIILSYFPESLAGYILGANLYIRSCGLMPACKFATDGHSGSNDLMNFGRCPSDATRDLTNEARRAAVSYIEESGSEHLEDVVSGIQWASLQIRSLHADISSILNEWRDPREAARQLIVARRPQALIYHGGVELDGRPMRDLLHDPDEFLNRLAASGLVRSGKPNKSPLLNALIAPRGKMFRVFSDSDISILSRWISGLPYDDKDISRVDSDSYVSSTGRGFEVEANWASHDVNVGYHEFKMDIRDAYTKLLHTEIAESTFDYANRYIENWLSRSKLGVNDGLCPLPEAWNFGILGRWLDARHSAASVDLEDDLPTREAVIADVLALAPLTMIDGAWLIGFSHPTLSSSTIGFPLFQTYYDELGNGRVDINHPVIYRDLVREIHGAIPATSEKSYAHHTIFSDRDFELPVYWLSIGRFPLTFKPEILGLNLAMELSGVGGGYVKVQRALKHYGFPTLFAELHNTIDNVATGHSAWAAASIDTYMSGLSGSSREAAWERIRAGFVSLNPPDAPSKSQRLRNRIKSII